MAKKRKTTAKKRMTAVRRWSPDVRIVQDQNDTMFVRCLVVLFSMLSVLFAAVAYWRYM